MQLSKDERDALVSEKVKRFCQELAEMGLETSFFHRAPGSARYPVAYLLIGETQKDLEEARADRRR
ncbi:hypothetical protein [Burkholderia cepacia]|uniref:hypothetical protein n=1 Tax=Burkholderia cepacia TaxID=292 RepID=UPI002AB65B57|nr:hypothetical protein [Burkholderia cepacia]